MLLVSNLCFSSGGSYQRRQNPRACLGGFPRRVFWWLLIRGFCLVVLRVVFGDFSLVQHSSGKKTSKTSNSRFFIWFQWVGGAGTRVCRRQSGMMKFPRGAPPRSPLAFIVVPPDHRFSVIRNPHCRETGFRRWLPDRFSHETRFSKPGFPTPDSRFRGPRSQWRGALMKRAALRNRAQKAAKRFAGLLCVDAPKYTRFICRPPVASTTATAQWRWRSDSR